MQSKSLARTWIVIAILAMLGPLVNVAQSATLFFSAPLGLPSPTDAMASSGSFGGYSFSGEWCLDDFCQSGATGSSTLRLTNLSLKCTSPREGGACGPVDIRFEADGFESLGMIQIFLSLDGSGSAIGNAGVCIADLSNICPSSLDSPQSVFVNFDGNLNPMSPPPLTVDTSGSPTFDVVGGFHLAGLAADTTGVSLTDSFKITITQQNVVGSRPPVPEPATGLLLGFGMVALIVLRKAFGNSTPN